MDEFDQNRVSQQAFLKHILQKPIVNIRRPHGTATQEMRRYASFIGTSNHKDLLTDTSGSRRYIVINVTGPIDCSPIDYEQLYARRWKTKKSSLKTIRNFKSCRLLSNYSMNISGL